tara:strand:+ start:3856 stop:4974 length:1119 start_codon:yes stop_codon:yes gene_type:complete
MNNKIISIYFILSFFISFSLIIFYYGNLNNYYLVVSDYGDNDNYFQLTDNFLKWNFSTFVYHPFGVSIIIALVNFITKINPIFLMILLNIIFAYFSIMIISKLFGNLTSIFFLIFGYEFTLVSLMGGSETSAIFFILFSLFLYESNFRKMAFFTSSFVYFIKPWAIALPIGIGLILLFKKEKKIFFEFLIISILMFCIYLIISYIIYGPGLIFEGYVDNQALLKGEKFFVDFPLVALIKEIIGPNSINGLSLLSLPITNLIKIFFYIIIIIIGYFLMLKKSKIYFEEDIYKIVFIFTSIQIFLIFTYNSPWIFHEFPRYTIMILPFIIFSLKNYLPSNKTLILSLIVLSAIFNAFSAVGFKNYIILIKNNFF